MAGHRVAMAAKFPDEEPCADEQQRNNCHYPLASRVGPAHRGATAIGWRGLTCHSTPSNRSRSVPTCSVKLNGGDERLGSLRHLPGAEPSRQGQPEDRLSSWKLHRHLC